MVYLLLLQICIVTQLLWLWESVILVLTPSTCKAYPIPIAIAIAIYYCITNASHPLRNIRPATDHRPPLSLSISMPYTPHTILVRCWQYRVKVKAKEQRSLCQRLSLPERLCAHNESIRVRADSLLPPGEVTARSRVPNTRCQIMSAG